MPVPIALMREIGKEMRRLKLKHPKWSKSHCAQVAAKVVEWMHSDLEYDIAKDAHDGLEANYNPLDNECDKFARDLEHDYLYPRP